MLSDRYETPFHMAGYAMVEALWECDAERVALNACYHDMSWYRGTVAFLGRVARRCSGNFVEQGWLTISM